MKFIKHFIYLCIIFIISSCGLGSKEVHTKTDNNIDNMKNNEEDREMKLYIDNVYIPVIWEDNETIDEIKNELKEYEITVKMKMYSNNEQVGSLDRRYKSADINMTTVNGDIVLYNNDKIVLFYGSNSWAYTKLGKINLPDDEIYKLLSTKNVILKISFD